MNINLLAKVSSTILITGETGTGKTTFARRIHNQSVRADSNFISVNLAGLSDELFLSELFGHKRGSFTGAYNDKIGFCDQVGGGTLFLDEVGDLSPKQQKYLLKLIDEKSFNSVGDSKNKSFKGTIILATHRDLESLVKSGQFREDLYFRIRIFTKELLPLRDSLKDLVLGIESKAIELNKRYDKSIFLSKPVLETLLSYSWPGNYRELGNSLEYVWLKTKGDMVNYADLPEWLHSEETQYPYIEEYADIERKYLIKQLIINNGKINQTARKIGISKSTLITKIKKYTIDLEYIKIVNHTKNELRRTS